MVWIPVLFLCHLGNLIGRRPKPTLSSTSCFGFHNQNLGRPKFFIKQLIGCRRWAIFLLTFCIVQYRTTNKHSYNILQQQVDTTAVLVAQSTKNVISSPGPYFPQSRAGQSFSNSPFLIIDFQSTIYITMSHCPINDIYIPTNYF